MHNVICMDNTQASQETSNGNINVFEVIADNIMTDRTINGVVLQETDAVS